MDSIDLLRAFQQVAALGNFSGAARRLGLSKATVSKYVAELEDRFGVRLLNRSNRSVSLTDAGALLIERIIPVIDMLTLMQDELKEHARRPTGRLRVSAPHGMGQGTFPQLLSGFLGRHPDVKISLHLTNRHVDMAEEGVDIALQLGPIANVDLIVRKLQRIRLVVCAAPIYWKRNGRPEHPTELVGHTCLTSSRLGPHPRWRFEDGTRALEIAVTSRMDASEAGPLIAAAIEGFGVLYIPEMLVQTQIEHGELVPALQDFIRTDIWLSAAYPRRRHNSAALRALLDFLEQESGWSPLAASRG